MSRFRKYRTVVKLLFYAWFMVACCACPCGSV